MASPVGKPEQGLPPTQSTNLPAASTANNKQTAAESVGRTRSDPIASLGTSLYARPLPAFGKVGRLTPMGPFGSTPHATYLPPSGHPRSSNSPNTAPFVNNVSGYLAQQITQFSNMRDTSQGSDSSTMSVASARMDDVRPGQEELNKDQGYLRLVHGPMGNLQQTSHTNPGPLGTAGTTLEELKTTPLFSGQVLKDVRHGKIGDFTGQDEAGIFPQYGLLGGRIETYSRSNALSVLPIPTTENLVFSNINAPWSAFICGSQGAGKSHSLTCLLENCLMSESPAAVNPKPLAGLVFHYDSFSGNACTQLCEAAYLCSAGIPVRVLVSPSNFHAMHKLYSNLPGLPDDVPKPKVVPLRIQQQQLDVTRIMTLMAMNDKGHTPLYMEVLYQVLRDMAMENNGSSGIDYRAFKARLGAQGFKGDQLGPLGLRLQLLESFLADPDQSAEAQNLLDGIFTSTQGTLTIVDLSCPFVNENDACALFTICLSLFMENRGDCGRVIALDEAHKVGDIPPRNMYVLADKSQFLTKSGEAEKLTEQLVSIIRQQRHLASRVIVATQEPTLAPSLMDLCNVSIVHRFNSPAWFKVLKEHLAGASLSNDHDGEELFQTIVGLQTGHALVFCPTASLDVDNGAVRRLGSAYVKAKIRSRVACDGGRSIMASGEAVAAGVGGSVGDNIIRPFNLPGSNPRGNGPARGMVAGPSRPRTATATSILTEADVSINDGNAPAAKGGPPVPTEPPVTVNADNAEVCLRAEVTDSLHRDANTLAFNRVRTAAAAKAGLPAGFFSEKTWIKRSKKIIKDQIAKHTEAYHIPKPRST